MRIAENRQQTMFDPTPAVWDCYAFCGVSFFRHSRRNIAWLTYLTRRMTVEGWNRLSTAYSGLGVVSTAADHFPKRAEQDDGSAGQSLAAGTLLMDDPGEDGIADRLQQKERG